MNLINKKERLLDLVFVIAVTVFPSILISIYTIVTGEDVFNIKTLNYDLHFFNSIIVKLTGILVLVYILYKQGRTIRDLGYSFSFMQIVRSILLAISAFVIFLIIYSILAPLLQNVDLRPRNIEIFKGKISVFYFLAIAVNPWFEELILRAYVISEVEWLTKNTILAVIASVFIQTIGHFYQGLIPALLLSVLFIVFSLYYVKSRKITPVIIAHLFFDIMAMMVHAAR